MALRNFFSKKISAVVATTFIVTIFFMTVYENIKQVLWPDIGIWSSHIITIIFVSFFSAVLAFFIAKHYNRLINILNHEITERKQTETARAESESKARFLSDILERCSQPFAVGGADGSLFRVNPAFCELTGYTKEEIYNIDWNKTLTPPEWYKYEAEVLEKIHNTGQPQRYEKEYIRKDGTRIHVELIVHEVCNAERDIEYYYGFITDISERKKAEAILQTRTNDLNERVKELNCLYGISALLEPKNISLEEILQGVVNLIPPSWQYPDSTCARLIVEERKYITTNFTETPWKQSADIIVHEKPVGTLEVYYLDEKPVIDEGPFLKEERNLLNALVERVGEIIERIQAEREVKALSGLLPICANCKKIRDDKGYWNQIEGYIQKHSDAQFSHGICPECSEKLYPELKD